MINELILLAHVVVIGSSALICLRLGKQALVGFISLCCILANLFVMKQITLFGFEATSADAFTVGAVFGINLLQEYFGKSVTKKAIWISFLLLAFYTIVSYIHIAYQPSIHDTMNPHYLPILELMPRITIASLVVYLFVQHVDSFLYGVFKHLTGGHYLIARNYLSIGICQLLDTVLFSFLGLYGIVHDIWSVIAVSYSIKLLVIVLTTPFIMLSKKVRQ